MKAVTSAAAAPMLATLPLGSRSAFSSRAFKPILRNAIVDDSGPAALRMVEFTGRFAAVEGLKATSWPSHRRAVLARRWRTSLAPSWSREPVERIALHGGAEQAIVAYIAAAGNDPLVMGAYGHGRLGAMVCTARPRRCFGRGEFEYWCSV